MKMEIDNYFCQQCKTYGQQVYDLFRDVLGNESDFSKRPVEVMKQAKGGFPGYSSPGFIFITTEMDKPQAEENFVFQLAHELGHHLLNNSELIFVDGKVKSIWKQQSEEFCVAVSIKALESLDMKDYSTRVIKYMKTNERHKGYWTPNIERLLNENMSLRELLLKWEKYADCGVTKPRKSLVGSLLPPKTNSCGQKPHPQPHP